MCTWKLANGPDFTQPFPVPRGRHSVFWELHERASSASNAPFPERDVGLPLSVGLSNKVYASRTQFQYLRSLVKAIVPAVVSITHGSLPVYPHSSRRVVSQMKIKWRCQGSRRPFW